MGHQLDNYKKRSFHRATILLILMSTLDALATDLGIRNGHIEEANPLMQIAYVNGLPLFYFIKIGLPLGMLYVSTKIEPKRIFLFLTYTALFLYTFVLLLHLFWIVVLFV